MRYSQVRNPLRPSNVDSRVMTLTRISCDVLGVVGVVKHAQGDVVDPGRMPADQPVQCRPVAVVRHVDAALLLVVAHSLAQEWAFCAHIRLDSGADQL